MPKQWDSSQQELQHEVENNSNLLQTIIDNIPGGIVKIILQNDKITPVFISDGWCAMVGDTHENIMHVYGNDAMAGIHPDDYDRVWSAFVTAMQTGQPINSVYRVGNTKGEYRWVNNRSSLVSEENGIVSYYAVYTDVTEEIKAKERQKKTEEKLMAAMEHTNIMYWEFFYDSNLCINGFKSIRDLGMPELMPNYPECVIKSGFVHPDSAEEFRLMHEKLKGGAPSLELDIKVLGAAGQIEWKKVRYTTICDESGMAVSALGTSEDITDKIMLNKKYEDSIEHYKNSIGENFLVAGHCNITKNEIMEILSADREDHLSAYGVKPEELFHSFSKKIVEDEKQCEFLNQFLNESLIDAYKKGITSHKMECLIRHKCNSLKYVMITVDVIKEPDTGELTGFFTVADATSETIYKKAINSIVDNYYDFIVDIDVNADTYTMLSKKRGLINPPPDTGTFSKINEEYARMFADEQSIEDCMEKLSFSYIEEHLENEATYSFNFKMYEDRVMRTKKIQVFPIDKTMNHIGLTQVDVTELLNIEQQKNEVLSHALISAERASKAKTEFLSRMSHDIRTPMNAIIGMTALTKRELDDKQKAMENLDVIDSSGKLLLRMINDLLDMSKIESGSMVQVMETFDCSKEWHNITEMPKVMFEQKQQRFQAAGNFVHQYFVGDVIRLKRVLLNLLNNAAKFTANNGIIKLKGSEEKTENPKISMLVFQIIDSGIGIPQDKLSSIFDPFTQLDSEAIHQGAGLGLSIVKSIVEANGGTITVQSEVGVGSTFTVAIPMKIAAENQSPAADISNEPVAAKLDLRGMSILLVEDHPVNTMVAKRLLEKYGAAIDTAENGAVGYEKFTKSKNGEYNLIFMDIQMPVMNGYEAARLIRKSEHPQAATIPIIAMTANAYPEDIKKSIDSGMNKHISKPIDMQMVAQAISAVTEDISPKKGDPQQ